MTKDCNDCNYKPDGTGVVMGDTKAMPDRGVSTGWHGADPMLDGKAYTQDATNSMGSITGSTKSDSESVPFGGPGKQTI